MYVSQSLFFNAPCKPLPTFIAISLWALLAPDIKNYFTVAVLVLFVCGPLEFEKYVGRHLGCNWIGRHRLLHSASFYSRLNTAASRHEDFSIQQGRIANIGKADVLHVLVGDLLHIASGDCLDAV